MVNDPLYNYHYSLNQEDTMGFLRDPPFKVAFLPRGYLPAGSGPECDQEYLTAHQLTGMDGTLGN